MWCISRWLCWCVFISIVFWKFMFVVLLLLLVGVIMSCGWLFLGCVVGSVVFVVFV